MSIVIDHADGIKFVQLLSVRGRCQLHLKGIRFKEGSPFTFAKAHYGLTGKNESVLAQLDQLVEDAIRDRGGSPVRRQRA